jgi:hypothetical protein
MGEGHGGGEATWFCAGGDGGWGRSRRGNLRGGSSLSGRGRTSCYNEYISNTGAYRQPFQKRYVFEREMISL